MVNDLVEYRQITLTQRSSKSDICYGYPFSVIHNKLWYYNIVLGGCPCSMQMSTNRHVFSFCSDVMKGIFLCKRLSWAVKHRFTTINLHTNAKGWSGSTHHHPDQEIQKCAFCQQSDEHDWGWGLFVNRRGVGTYCTQ
jgi:hypothetical protein